MSAAIRVAPADPRWETALEVAIAVADAAGTNAVTLRSVADRAGLSLTMVQRDFGSRDRMVATMVQHILSSRTRPSPRSADPIAALTRLGEDEWTAYRAHPWLVTVLASTRPPLAPAVLDAARATIEVFMSTGLGGDAALDRYLAFSAYIQGMGLLLIAEHQESVRSGASHRAWWQEEIRRLNRTGAAWRHSWLTELADQPAAADFDVDASFHDGLHSVVRGLVQATGS